MDVFKKADKVFLSTKTTEMSAGVAAIALPKKEVPEVAAFKPKPPNQGGNKGGGGNGGGKKPPKMAPSHDPQFPRVAVTTIKSGLLTRGSV